MLKHGGVSLVPNRPSKLYATDAQQNISLSYLVVRRFTRIVYIPL